MGWSTEINTVRSPPLGLMGQNLHMAYGWKFCSLGHLMTLGCPNVAMHYLCVEILRCLSNLILQWWWCSSLWSGPKKILPEEHDWSINSIASWTYVWSDGGAATMSKGKKKSKKLGFILWGYLSKEILVKGKFWSKRKVTGSPKIGNTFSQRPN